MWRVEAENICFQEVDVVKCKNLEAVEVENMEEPPKCIVEHPGFQAICLNYWVLQAAWQYKQQYGASAYEGSDHKKKQAHCPQATGKVVLGLPWQGHKSYPTILCS